MKDCDPRRRQLLQMIATAPLALAVGCGTDSGKQATKTTVENVKEALKKLILHLGPWETGEKTKADDFAARFVESEVAAGPYLSGSAEIIKSLAERLATGVTASDKVDLGPLSAGERGLLIKLVEQIYSFVDVRFHLAKEPPFGQCVGDPTWHTRAPGK